MNSTAPLPAVDSAYLIVDGERIFELTANSVLNVGRLESNDIMLDDYKVSREHAVIKSNDDEFLLVDLASTHGSYVNGERVDRHRLNFGDKINIIGHELTLAQEIPAELKERGLGVTGAKSARSLDRRLKFFGGLNEFSLITLVQFLAQEKQSGLLLLELGQTPGPRLYFKEGEIVHVSEGHDLGDLLTRQHHDPSLFFYFHHETNFPPRTIHASCASYLMDLCQSHDQRQHESNNALAKTNPLGVTSRIALPSL